LQIISAGKEVGFLPWWYESESIEQIEMKIFGRSRPQNKEVD